MKRSHAIPLEFLVLAAMAMAFTVLASPADAATCMRVGDYYPVVRQCVAERAMMDGTLPQLALLAAVASLTAGGVLLRRHVLGLRFPG